MLTHGKTINQQPILTTQGTLPIVFDRFHIIQNINQAIDEVRRTAVAKATKDDKKVIKGSRYLLLSNPSDLTESGRAKLENLIEVNQEISIAYLLKEQFQRVYQRYEPST